MSFTFSKNTLSNDSGKINIDDKIFIYPGKIFETQKFFSKNNYVFEKDALCPIAYIAIRSTSTSASGTCIFNHSSGNLESITGVEASVYKPPFFTDLMTLMKSSAITSTVQYYWSCVTSPFASTDANATTEKTNFLKALKPISSLYSASAVPVINAKPTAVSSTLSSTSNPVSVKTQSSTQIFLQNNASDKWSYVILMVKVKK